MVHVTEFLLAAPAASKAAERKMAAETWEQFRDHGCLAKRESWGAEISDWNVVSFPTSGRAACNGNWGEKTKEFRVAGMREIPFDGKRMMWGGFEKLLRTSVPAEAAA